MIISVNDRKVELAEGSTLSNLLDKLGLPPARVAIELNGLIVPRAGFSVQELKGGDRVEIVQFVGGG